MMMFIRFISQVGKSVYLYHIDVSCGVSNDSYNYYPIKQQKCYSTLTTYLYYHLYDFSNRDMLVGPTFFRKVVQIMIQVYGKCSITH